jgi:hypothetical protein
MAVLPCQKVAGDYYPEAIPRATERSVFPNMPVRLSQFVNAANSELARPKAAIGGRQHRVDLAPVFQSAFVIVDFIFSSISMIPWANLVA